ncbi:MAG: hypothetical protein GEU91_12120 [Rhizobiales bacterium]|nr:hypothetical protein [Hyphomicrobiales bacterium]
MPERRAYRWGDDAWVPVTYNREALPLAGWAEADQNANPMRLLARLATFPRCTIKSCEKDEG